MTGPRATTGSQAVDWSFLAASEQLLVALYDYLEALNSERGAVAPVAEMGSRLSMLAGDVSDMARDLLAWKMLLDQTPPLERPVAKPPSLRLIRPSD